ncbi:hypothetical protein HK098_001438 [Nowakowskiella sp. JEL0407]|nr:hypothetical protein HK098_001438 [Nowakowskiella sp. JEL0407]
MNIQLKILLFIFIHSTFAEIIDSFSFHRQSTQIQILERFKKFEVYKQQNFPDIFHDSKNQYQDKYFNLPRKRDGSKVENLNLLFYSSSARHGDIVEGAYFLQLKVQKDVDIGQTHVNFENHLKKRGIFFRDRIEFDQLSHNYRSIQLNSPDDLIHFQQHPDVENIWPLRWIEPPKAIESQQVNLPQSNITNPGDVILGPTEETAVYGTIDDPAKQITGVKSARETFGLSGKGILIGIIDTGIDYRHQAFGSCTALGSKCPKIKIAIDFVDDNYTGNNQQFVLGKNPLDCNGHGTHVAGIIAGNDQSTGFVGVAPDASLAIYRVFGCNGASSSDVVLSAILRAAQDGCDIVNMSLGGDGGSLYEPETLIISKVTDKFNILINVAQGNAQKDGLWMTSTPGNAATVTAAVASVNNKSFRKKKAFQITTDTTRVIKYAYTTNPTDQLPEPASEWNLIELVANNSTTSIDDACYGISPRALKSIVLVQNGGCSSMAKYNNAVKGGAYAMMIYNDATSESGIPAIVGQMQIPVFMIDSHQDGVWLFESLMIAVAQGKKVYPIFNDDFTYDINPASYKLSYFTSWGPTANLDLTPTISAPGGDIVSSFLTTSAKWKVLSGTSMATPFVSGCLALIVENFKKTNSSTSRDDVVKLIMNNATPVEFTDSLAGLGVLAPVTLQGGGLINVFKAIQAKTAISPPKIILGFTGIHSASASNLLVAGTLKIQNKASTDVSYTVRHVLTSTVDSVDSTVPILYISKTAQYPTYLPPFTRNDIICADVNFQLGTFDPLNSNVFSNLSFIVPAGTSQYVSVLLTLNPMITYVQNILSLLTGRDKSQLYIQLLYGGYVNINSDAGDSFNVPYSGMTGTSNYQNTLDFQNPFEFNSSDTQNLWNIMPSTPSVVYGNSFAPRSVDKVPERWSAGGSSNYSAKYSQPGVRSVITSKNFAENNIIVVTRPIRTSDQNSNIFLALRLVVPVASMKVWVFKCKDSPAASAALPNIFRLKRSKNSLWKRWTAYFDEFRIQRRAFAIPNAPVCGRDALNIGDALKSLTLIAEARNQVTTGLSRRPADPDWSFAYESWLNIIQVFQSTVEISLNSTASYGTSTGAGEMGLFDARIGSSTFGRFVSLELLDNPTKSARVLDLLDSSIHTPVVPTRTNDGTFYRIGVGYTQNQFIGISKSNQMDISLAWLSPLIWWAPFLNINSTANCAEGSVFC